MTEIFQKKIHGAYKKRKRVNQGDQNSQDRVILHPSDTNSDLSEDTTSQRKDSEDPLSKYARVDSDAQVEGGDQDNSYKDLLEFVHL